MHVHIIPRGAGDLEDRGGGDAIYAMMDGEEGDLGRWYVERLRAKRGSGSEKQDFAGPDADRRPRGEEEMRREAEWLRGEMERDRE